ncbi:MAG: sensor histidine kinase, partial [Candidatus Latescibacterota bacterium]
DDSIMWVRERAELEFDNAGLLRGGFGTVQDITGRKSLEQRIAQLRREQEAFMRHEVKNHFTPVQIYAEMLLRDTGNLTEQQVHYLQRIAESTVRVSGFIDSLKRIHDIETGTYCLQREEYPLDAIIRQAIRDLEPLAERSEVTVRYNPPRKHILMPLDIQLMPGVFTNLIKNAIEHVMNLGNPEEKVVTVNFRKERKRRVIRINNKGEPVPPDRLATFFEMFNSGKEKSHGTGLGTTYAYLVAKAHGGDVTVTSNREEGTTLTVAFSAE